MVWQIKEIESLRRCSLAKIPIAKRLLRIKANMIPGGKYESLIGNEFLEWATYSIEPSNPDNISRPYIPNGWRYV